MKRFERNIPAITAGEQELLTGKSVFIAGLGGLGGYLAELMARLGVGCLYLADGDRFEESNLNRQLYATVDTLGKGKAQMAAERVSRIAPDIRVQTISGNVTDDNADELLAHADLVMDALDDPDSRLMLAEACARRGIYMIHGAVSGWQCQSMILSPGSDALHRLYALGASGRKDCLAPCAAFCAARQAAEGLKVLCARSFRSELLWMYDLENGEQSVLEL